MNNESKETLFSAWAKAAAEFPDIPKNKTAKIMYKDRSGSFTYDYSDLETMIKTLRPVLGKYGLFVTQSIEGTDVVTTICHSSGASLNSLFPICPASKPQDWGVNATYAKRYGYKQALGIEAGEEDTDAAQSRDDAASFSIQQKPPKPQSTTASPPVRAIPNFAPSSAKPSANQGPSEKQIKRIYAIAKGQGWDQMYTRAFVIAQTGLKCEELPRNKYDEICEVLNKTPFNEEMKRAYSSHLESRSALEQLEIAKIAPPSAWDSDDEIPF